MRNTNGNWQWYIKMFTRVSISIFTQPHKSYLYFFKKITEDQYFKQSDKFNWSKMDKLTEIHSFYSDTSFQTLILMRSFFVTKVQKLPNKYNSEKTTTKRFSTTNNIKAIESGNDYPWKLEIYNKKAQ